MRVSEKYSEYESEDNSVSLTILPSLKDTTVSSISTNNSLSATSQSPSTSQENSSTPSQISHILKNVKVNVKNKKQIHKNEYKGKKVEQIMLPSLTNNNNGRTMNCGRNVLPIERRKAILLKKVPTYMKSLKDNYNHLIFGLKLPLTPTASYKNIAIGADGDIKPEDNHLTNIKDETTANVVKAIENKSRKKSSKLAKENEYNKIILNKNTQKYEFRFRVAVNQDEMLTTLRSFLASRMYNQYKHQWELARDKNQKRVSLEKKNFYQGITDRRIICIERFSGCMVVAPENSNLTLYKGMTCMDVVITGPGQNNVLKAISTIESIYPELARNALYDRRNVEANLKRVSTKVTCQSKDIPSENRLDVLLKKKLNSLAHFGKKNRILFTTNASIIKNKDNGNFVERQTKHLTPMKFGDSISLTTFPYKTMSEVQQNNSNNMRDTCTSPMFENELTLITTEHFKRKRINKNKEKRFKEQLMFENHHDDFNEDNTYFISSRSKQFSSNENNIATIDSSSNNTNLSLVEAVQLTDYHLPFFHFLRKIFKK